MKSSFASPANLPSAKSGPNAIVSLPLKPVSRNFILEIDLTNRGPDIVRMEPLLRRYMFKSDLGSLKNLLEGKIVPRVRGRCVRFGPVDDSPIVVVVFMWVEGDLLFCQSARVHAWGSLSLRFEPVG